MSLKVFHIIFVTASVILLGWFGFWSMSMYSQWVGAGAFLLCAGLVVYEINFIKKISKKI